MRDLSRAAGDPRLANLNGGQLLRKLAKNNICGVRQAVAKNPRSANVRDVTGRPLILTLCKNADESVRNSARGGKALKVLKNRQLHDDVLNVIKIKTGANLRIYPRVGKRSRLAHLK